MFITNDWPSVGAVGHPMIDLRLALLLLRFKCAILSIAAPSGRADAHPCAAALTLPWRFYPMDRQHSKPINTRVKRFRAILFQLSIRIRNSETKHPVRWHKPKRIHHFHCAPSGSNVPIADRHNSYHLSINVELTFILIAHDS